MPFEWIPELEEYCRQRGVLFLSTPFDERSADELEPYVPAFKVASYTMSHHPFLRHLARSDLPIIMSTGAHDAEEVAESLSVLRDASVEGSSFYIVLRRTRRRSTPPTSGSSMGSGRLSTCRRGSPITPSTR